LTVPPLALPQVIGHRGAAASAPENTKAGFARAAALGAAWVELDVQLTRDGIPVVFHDDTLERTTSGRGALVDTDLAGLKRLDAGAWFAPGFAGEPVPTLEEVLVLLVELGLSVNLEIKAGEARGRETCLGGLAVACAVWPADRPKPLMSSFAESALIAAAEAAPEWPRGLLCETWPEDWRQRTTRLDCRSLHVHWRHLTASRVAAVKEAGLAVLAYTVNERRLARRLWDWGVDAVFSDRPERLLVGAG
jgi:glycerophosphoryl diester phosphodiesterase